MSREPSSGRPAAGLRNTFPVLGSCSPGWKVGGKEGSGTEKGGVGEKLSQSGSLAGSGYGSKRLTAYNRGAELLQSGRLARRSLSRLPYFGGKTDRIVLSPLTYKKQSV